MRVIVALAVLTALSACSPKVITKTEVQTVRVPVRLACPDSETYQALKSLRPVPLRTQPVPPSAEERVAKVSAQLGRYEAEGAWADRVLVVLDRCQAEGVASPDATK